MLRTFILCFGAVLSVTPINATAAPALAQVSQDWAREWQSKNLDAVLALYTPDAVFLNSDGSRVAGRPALRKFFATVLEQYSAEPHLSSIASSASGDLAYDWGDYREIITPVANPAGAIETRGTYLVILKRMGGRWKIAEQMWTGDKPVPVKR